MTRARIDARSRPKGGIAVLSRAGVSPLSGGAI
jgi:hypothetical protein